MSDPTIFSPDTLKFLRALKKNNTRDWFHENKAWYEAAWKTPANAFIEAMCFRLQAETDTEHSAKLFRIHRDIRFSKDKTPYNSHLHILFRREGSKAGLFFGLQTDRLVLGAGMMGFDKAQLNAYRDAVAGPAGETLEAEIKALLKQGGRMNAPDLARVPKPFEKEHERSELLRRKALTIWRDFDDPRDVERADILETCAKQFATYNAFCSWLNQHIPTATGR
ncbi:MAG: DUF2461 domain-containing protein [Pseudomonadota bacterium]